MWRLIFAVSFLWIAESARAQEAKLWGLDVDAVRRELQADTRNQNRRLKTLWIRDVSDDESKVEGSLGLKPKLISRVDTENLNLLAYMYFGAGLEEVRMDLINLDQCDDMLAWAKRIVGVPYQIDAKGASQTSFWKVGSHRIKLHQQWSASKATHCIFYVIPFPDAGS